MAGYPGSNMAGSGCAITSIAVIASGYGVDMNPGEVNAYAKSTSTPDFHDITLSSLIGKDVQRHQSGNFKQIMLDELTAGRPVMVRTSYYSPSHYFCILAISEDGNQVYVSDVAGECPGQDRNGWQPVSFLDRINREVFTISE